MDFERTERRRIFWARRPEHVQRATLLAAGFDPALIKTASPDWVAGLYVEYRAALLELQRQNVERGRPTPVTGPVLTTAAIVQIMRDYVQQAGLPDGMPRLTD